MQKKTLASSVWFIAGLCGIFLALSWFYYLSPRPENIHFTHPDLSSTDQAPSTINHKSSQDGLYWLDFTTSPRLFALNNLRLRTASCVHYLTTSHGEWNIPKDLKFACDNTEGIPLQGTAKTLQKETTWHIAGSTQGENYGAILDVDWREPSLIFGLILLGMSLAMALYSKLPLPDGKERLGVTFILCGALFLRFWFVFIVSPPETSLFSDMGAYFQRAWEIDHGIHNLHQLFQPVGFTLWSLFLRNIGGFELFNWSQVFLSWGVVLLIFMIVRERFGRLAGCFALLAASLHIPQAAFASLHMAEMAYTFLITLTLWCIFRALKNQKFWGFFVIGFLFALSFYFKGNHSFFIPVFSLWILYQDRRDLISGLRKVALMVVGGFVVIVPYLVWTGIVYDKPQFGPSAGALNFVEGKCPFKDNEDSLGARWLSPLHTSLGETTFKQWPRPFTDQAYFWRQGIKCVEENPLVMVSSLRYVYYLFAGNDLWPVIETPLKKWYFPWTYFFYYFLLPLSLTGALVLARQKEPLTEVSALMVLTLFFTVWFFKSENRFRVPFDAIIIVWGSVGFSWGLEKIRAWSLKRIKLLIEPIKVSS